MAAEQLLDLSETQTERVRDEPGDLHQWHRDTMLPRHAELLQKVQQQLPSAISPGQACRTYAERLRRQKNLVQVLQKITEDRINTDQARSLLRGYLTRFQTSPDATYLRYVQVLVEEGCEGFSNVHNAMRAAQRLKAVQSVKGYERDFLVLAAQ